VEVDVAVCCRRMENALKQLSDDHSLSSCIALGHEPPVLGTSSLSFRYFISLIFTFAELGAPEVAGYISRES